MDKKEIELKDWRSKLDSFEPTEEGIKFAEHLKEMNYIFRGDSIIDFNPNQDPLFKSHFVAPGSFLIHLTTYLGRYIFLD